VPEGVEYVELEVETPNDVILDENGQIRLKTEAEKLEEEKQKKLAELRRYIASLLAPTDYIIIKIGEAEILGNTEEVERLKQRYAEQLQQRQAIREWNEQMKQAINEAKTLEELRSLEVRYHV
jgi:F0F1-type ATP synthase membrane subunit b/b'